MTLYELDPQNQPAVSDEQQRMRELISQGYSPLNYDLLTSFEETGDVVPDQNTGRTPFDDLRDGELL